MNSESKTEGLPYGWDGKDWRRYKWIMRTIFREHDLLEIAEEKLTRAGLTSQETEAAFDKKQYKIMRMIGTTLPSNRLQQVDQYETGTDIWKALCEIYERRQNATIRESTILRLSEELKNMKCSRGDYVQAHVARMFSLKTELVSYGYEVNNINMKSMMLESLPNQTEFEQLRGAVKYGGYGGTLTPEELRVLIEEAADRPSKRGDCDRSGGSRGRSSGRRQGAEPGDAGGQQQGGGRSRGRGGGRQQEEGGSDDKTGGRTCFRCGQTGHFRANWPGRTAQGAQRKKQSNFARSTVRGRDIAPSEPGVVGSAAEEAHNTGVVEHPEVAPGLGANTEPAGPPSRSWWCFDSGSNAHIVGDLGCSVHMENILPETITADVHGVAHSMATQAKGIGTVKITSVVKDRLVDLFIDDLYVPGATHGLLSKGLALEQGFEVDYDRATQIYSVFKGDQEVIHAFPAQGIWMFDTTANRAVELPAKEGAVVKYTVADGVGSLLQVWHDRLGHALSI